MRELISIMIFVLFFGTGPQVVKAQTFDFKFGANGGDGSSGTGAGEFLLPNKIIVNDLGMIYVADSANHRVQIFDAAGTFLRQIGSGSPGNVQGTGTNNQLNNPTGLVLGLAGNLFIADSMNHQILKCDPSDNCVVFAGGGPSNQGFLDGVGTLAHFSFPSGLTVDTSGNLIISEGGNHAIRRCIDFSAVCTTVAGQGPTNPGLTDGNGFNAQFNFPGGLGRTKTGTILVADTNNHAIREINLTTGNVTTVLGNGQQGNTQGDGSTARFDQPRDVKIDESGGIYVADDNNNRVAIYQSDGTFVKEFGVLGVGDGQLNNPFGVFVDPDKIYVSDTQNHRIQVFSRDFVQEFPDISVNSLTLNFGDVVVGQSEEVLAIAENLGPVSLDIGPIGDQDGLGEPYGFGVDTCSLQTIQPSENCEVAVQFQPNSIGTFTDTFNIPSNDPDSPSVTVQVSGQGIGPPTLGGSASGLTIKKVICRNKTTGQEVTIEILGGSNSWNCEEAGLIVNPGDKVRMRIKGNAE